jgi:catecholate siderophore receptor
MTHIKSRKHAQSRFNPTMAAALATALIVPAIGHAEEKMLPRINVTATQENAYKAEQASSPKYTQPLVDTPQTITVIKKELIDQQGATTLTEALRNTPGVGTFFLGENGSTNTGDALYMRGFDSSSSIFVDNVRDLGSVSRDMFNISQVEVLKGPAGTDNGRGSPTGSFNLVTIQPDLVDGFLSSLTVGSGSQKRVTADWNKVIDKANGMAFRLDLVKQDSGAPGRREVENKRYGIAPSFVYGLNSPTRVYLDYLRVDQDNVPDGGVPTIGLPGYTSPDPARPFITGAAKVDPKNFYGLKTDFDKVRSDMLTARVEHDFSPQIKLQNTTRYAKTAQDYLLTSFMGSKTGLLTPVASDPSTWTLERSIPTRKDQTNEMLTNQTNITTKFATGRMTHTMVGGVEFTQEKQATIGYLETGDLPAANLYNPNPDAATPGFSLTRNGTGTDGKTNTASAYLFDTLKLNQQWQISGGLRVDHYKTDFADSFFCGSRRRPTCASLGLAENALSTAHVNSSGNLFNWKLAAVYKPTDYSSVYALYATSQQPPGGANFSLSAASNSGSPASNAGNPAYAPQKTGTAEIGTKWDLLNKRLAVTAAVFRTQVENDVEKDPTSGEYFQTGKKRVQGIELGVTGDITRAWAVSARLYDHAYRGDQWRDHHGERRKQSGLHAETGIYLVDHLQNAIRLDDRRRCALRRRIVKR